jgi:SAM-dependent methyltransferase
MTMELGRRAGPAGSAVGIDLDHELLDIARAVATENRIENVEFRTGSAFDHAESGFDVTYARCLLMHVPDVEALVSVMWDALKPRGVVIVEDCDFLGCFTEPELDAYRRVVEWYRETVRRRGGDPERGRRMARVFADAGFEDVRVCVSQPLHRSGPLKELMSMSFTFTRDAILAEGVTGPDEYDAAHEEVKAFTADPTTLVSSPRLIQTWARKPA